MALHRRSPYRIRPLTDESLWVSRRWVLEGLGYGLVTLSGLPARTLLAGGAGSGSSVLDQPGELDRIKAVPLTVGTRQKAPPLHPGYRLDREMTRPEAALSYNNFYEFSTTKEVSPQVGGFKPRPWTLTVDGLCASPRTYDVDDLIREMGVEERHYRHRCVEAWSMALPWIGFPLRKLIENAGPRPEARYVRLISFLRPEEAPGQKNPDFTWPYFEGLTLAEATHELAFLATGLFGQDLAPQSGAPIRLVTPWKYGFKGIKSIVRIELTRTQPPTFWNSAIPSEYDFSANVDPAVPHPRWSQARERFIVSLTDQRTVDTLPYNGYGDLVSALYKKG